MPIYEYECRKCGPFEHFQTMAEDALKRCPSCKSKVSKLISASSFHLKGGGWYADGYQKGGSGNGDSKKPSSSESASSSSTKSKPSSGSSEKGSSSTKSGADSAS